MNEMDCGLKEIKMKHDQWSVDLRKWDETWTMKCGLWDMIWNMNNDVNNVTKTTIWFNCSYIYLAVLYMKLSVTYISYVLFLLSVSSASYLDAVRKKKQSFEVKAQLVYSTSSSKNIRGKKTNTHIAVPNGAAINMSYFHCILIHHELSQM